FYRAPSDTTPDDPRPLHLRLTRPFRTPMSLNGMAESRRRRCYRAVWLKCSKTVAVQSQVLPVRRGRDFKKARKIVRQTQAPSPVFLIEAPGRPVVSVSFAARPQPRARGTPGVQVDPRASTPRDIEARRSPALHLLLWFERGRSKTASPPNPRRPARGV